MKAKQDITLLAEHADKAIVAAGEAGCFAREGDERPYANTLDGDRAARDAGALPSEGLSAYLDNEGLPEPNRELVLDLIERAASDYGIEYGESDKWAAVGAEKLQILALALIREFRRDLFELEPQPQWPSYKKKMLARDADFIRRRDNLATDRKALEKLAAWLPYQGESIHRLVKYLGEGRRLNGVGQRRGRPRKLAPPAQK